MGESLKLFQIIGLYGTLFDTVIHVARKNPDHSLYPLKPHEDFSLPPLP